jgi:hypothetical protein
MKLRVKTKEKEQTDIQLTIKSRLQDNHLDGTETDALPKLEFTHQRGTEINIVLNVHGVGTGKNMRRTEDTGTRSMQKGTFLHRPFCLLPVILLLSVINQPNSSQTCCEIRNRKYPRLSLHTVLTQYHRTVFITTYDNSGISRLFFCCGAATQRGSWLPHSWCF